MRKVIKDGMVAVLVSPSYGAGWFTWNSETPECLFSPEVVEWVLNGKQGKVPTEQFADTSFYAGAAIGLEVVLVPVGSRFIITEYDGYETLNFPEDFQWIEA